ncbi:MAG: aminotransferase class V-fold PLP-dependent enzyme [Gemmatimonadetes bacterium]|nr:aminotransferase class V-fold PLP-dependent enzyme [Gemmatimonadota bacterium]
MPLDRRSFLSVLGGTTLTWPRTVEAFARQLAPGGAPTDESFWGLVRAQFLIPPDRIYLNNGTLGPSPYVVVDAVTEHIRRVAMTYPPGVAWDDLKQSLSSLLGGDADGFVFPRNTTEAMNFVAHGLELEPGDEVLTTDHEHIGGLEPWKLVTARQGLSLHVVSLPVPARSADDLLRAVWSGVTDRTRVMSVSHLTFTTGTILPIRELANRCAERGIVLVVDGAHPPGMIQLDLAALGGDFYASSPHKWLLAPQGTGLLYLSEGWRERLWPTLASGGWDDLSLGAHRFNHMGTMDESRLAGLLAASEFFLAIGMDRVEARVRYLQGLLQDGLASIAGVALATPADNSMRAAIVSFRMEGVESLALQGHLSRTEQIRTRVIGEYDYGWMRLSTHIYNGPDDIERTLELLSDVARNGIPARG